MPWEQPVNSVETTDPWELCVISGPPGRADRPLETPERLEGLLALGSLTSVVGAAVGSRIWQMAAMWIMWFTRRFLAHESRCRSLAGSRSRSGRGCARRRVNRYAGNPGVVTSGPDRRGASATQRPHRSPQKRLNSALTGTHAGVSDGLLPFGYHQPGRQPGARRQGRRGR